MAEGGDASATDLSNLDHLASEQDKKLRACDEDLRRWRQYSADYRTLRLRLNTLPERVSHQVTVPLGPLAFAPGRLVHTNELLVLLGDNWFCKTSAHNAGRIVHRRLNHCEQMVSRLQKERQLFSDWRQQTTAIQGAHDGDVREIVEPLDEQEEAKWRQQHRRRVAEHKRQEAKLREQTMDHADVMAKLDAHERLELQRDEMDRLSDDEANSDTDSDGGSSDGSSSDGSVIIRPSPEPPEDDAATPLDSDDSDEPPPPPPPPAVGLRKRVSFSGRGGATVHRYDADAPATSGEPAALEPPPPPPPASILKPGASGPLSEADDGRPPWRADEDGVGVRRRDEDGVGVQRRDEDGVGVQRRDEDGVGVQRRDEDGVGVRRRDEDALPPAETPTSEQLDQPPIFSYKIQERDVTDVPAAVAEVPKRPLSRFRASRSQL